MYPKLKIVLNIENQRQLYNNRPLPESRSDLLTLILEEIGYEASGVDNPDLTSLDKRLSKLALYMEVASYLINLNIHPSPYIKLFPKG